MVPWDFSLENELHVIEEKVSDITIYFYLAYLLSLALYLILPCKFLLLS